MFLINGGLFLKPKLNSNGVSEMRHHLFFNELYNNV
jgi:hypothetical protein